MEPEGSLPHSQVSATCLYPVPARSSPFSPHHNSWKSILILSSHLRLGLPSGLFQAGKLLYLISFFVSFLTLFVFFSALLSFSLLLSLDFSIFRVYFFYVFRPYFLHFFSLPHCNCVCWLKSAHSSECVRLCYHTLYQSCRRPCMRPSVFVWRSHNGGWVGILGMRKVRSTNQSSWYGYTVGQRLKHFEICCNKLKKEPRKLKTTTRPLLKVK